VNLTAADVAEIMRLVEQSKFDELSLEVGGVKVTLRRAGKSGMSIANETTPLGITGAAAAGASRPEAETMWTVARAGASTPVDASLKDITAPMLGIFYRAPKPGSPPFVEVGSVVEEETVIAMIEVMKLMNTVRAGVRGTITEILPADQALVESGEVLARVQADGTARG
jgi:acetyl-CoA carboxylase biotin carboxyl carrier protein